MDEEVIIKVVNQVKFMGIVHKIDLSNLKSDGNELFNGGIYIHTVKDGIFPFYGLIEKHDFEDQYGFVLDTIAC